MEIKRLTKIKLRILDESNSIDVVGNAEIDGKRNVSFIKDLEQIINDKKSYQIQSSLEDIKLENEIWNVEIWNGTYMMEGVMLVKERGKEEIQAEKFSVKIKIIDEREKVLTKEIRIGVGESQVTISRISIIVYGGTFTHTQLLDEEK